MNLQLNMLRFSISFIWVGSVLTMPWLILPRLTPRQLKTGRKNISGRKRAAQWDKEQVALTWQDAEKIREQHHKKSIVEFRDASERQARMMMEISEDLLGVLTKRVKDAQNSGEEVPLALVSGLLRATANITEQSRQAWASALGVEDMLQLVEQELERVEVEELNDDDEIIIDE